MQAEQSQSRFDAAVFGVCELLALLFGLPVGEDLVRGMPISGRQWAFLGIGVAFAAAGPMWPLIRERTGPTARMAVERAARDARSWLAIVLFGFAYFASREVVDRFPTANQIADVISHKQPSASDIADAITRKLPNLTAPMDSADDSAIATQLAAAQKTISDLTRQLDATNQQLASRRGMSLKETAGTIERLARLFNQIPSLTAVITAPPENREFHDDFEALIFAACRAAPSANCTIEPAPDPNLDVDSGIPDPDFAGLVIHHAPKSVSDVIVNNMLPVLNCLNAKKSPKMPDAIERLNVNGVPNFYWFEIGRGSPWRTDGRCG